MFVFSIILIVIGIAAVIYGFMLNNSFEAQFSYFFDTGSVDPGTVWIIGGVIALVLGIVLLAVSMSKKKKETSAAVVTDSTEAGIRKKCPHCGAVIDSDAVFCSVCGKDVRVKEEAPVYREPEKPEVICPNCGKHVEKGARFCSACGYDFTRLSGSDADVRKPEPIRRPEPVREPEPVRTSEP
ncbi:MAG: zinc-ribbon domain-containing protein, partial [Lachnospiraceae bacterium]|nr:zinc-ribbon domain-containing protein [Lachnospiraceae bacterium]